MFRKLPEAIEQWSMENVAICAARQKEILDNAAVMLKPGGTIVYSTCTFSKEENEDLLFPRGEESSRISLLECDGTLLRAIFLVFFYRQPAQ